MANERRKNERSNMIKSKLFLRKVVKSAQKTRWKHTTFVKSKYCTIKVCKFHETKIWTPLLTEQWHNVALPTGISSRKNNCYNKQHDVPPRRSWHFCDTRAVDDVMHIKDALLNRHRFCTRSGNTDTGSQFSFFVRDVHFKL